MKLLKKYICLSLFLFFIMKSFAQDAVAVSGNANQNNFMTSDGKIFVVMAVVVVIVFGLFLYLFNLDRKISKLEKNIKS
ncbi:MAG: CcmD family protein [Parafilimonas sp.]